MAVLRRPLRCKYCGCYLWNAGHGLAKFNGRLTRLTSLAAESSLELERPWPKINFLAAAHSLRSPSGRVWAHTSMYVPPARLPLPHSEFSYVCCGFFASAHRFLLRPASCQDKDYAHYCARLLFGERPTRPTRVDRVCDLLRPVVCDFVVRAVVARVRSLWAVARGPPPQPQPKWHILQQ